MNTVEDSIYKPPSSSLLHATQHCNLQAKVVRDVPLLRYIT